MFGDVGAWVSDVLANFGSFGLFFLLFLENLFPPIPSEAILPLAGFLIWRGDLGAPQALAAATLGSLAGAYALYALGRWGGRPLVLRFGRVLRVTEQDLDSAEGWFEKYGSIVVFVARMIPGARSIVSIPAGMLHMPLARFTLLTLAGSAVWNTLLLTAGYILGKNWTRVSEIVGSSQTSSSWRFWSWLLPWWRGGCISGRATAKIALAKSVDSGGSDVVTGKLARQVVASLSCSNPYSSRS